MIELHGGFARVDADGFAALLAAEPAELGDARLQAAVAAVLAPEATIRVVAAGPEVRLEHELWVGEEALALRLALDENTWQVMADGIGFLPAALARVARLEPVDQPATTAVPWAPEALDRLVHTSPLRRVASYELLDCESAWCLEITTAEGQIAFWVTDGDRGPRLYADESQLFQPVSNTEVFQLFTRLLATLLDRD